MARNEAEEELEGLRRQLAQVEAEKTRLIKRVRQLAREVKADGQGKPEASQDPKPDPVLVPAGREPNDALSCVTDVSPLAAKAKLLRSLFRGREDVFARLWVSTKDGKAGYSPVCTHD